MAPDGDAPRPRRERPLVAPGREPSEPEPVSEPEASAEPTVTTRPTGPPIVEAPDSVETVERDDHVEISLDGPTQQRRWTIALRVLLAVPHFLLLYLINIALPFAIIAAWFVALFTARAPQGLAEFIAKALQYQARVTGYSFFLLTDRYPPFGFDDSDYAINVRTQPGRLNRAAVLFRLILMIPSYVIATAALAGAFPVMALGWFLALVLGRLPTPLWEANAAVLRYSTRMFAFGGLLTAEQPKRLFGDTAARHDESAQPVDLPDLPTTPRVTRLVLSKGGRALVGLFLALGIVSYVGIAVAVIASAGTNQAYDELVQSEESLDRAVATFNAEAQQCAISGGPECLHAANNNLAVAFDRFASDIASIDFPLSASGDAVVRDARLCAETLRVMATANDPASYSAAFAEYERRVDKLFEDLDVLATQLYYA